MRTYEPTRIASAIRTGFVAAIRSPQFRFSFLAIPPAMFLETLLEYLPSLRLETRHRHVQHFLDARIFRITRNNVIGEAFVFVQHANDLAVELRFTRRVDAFDRRAHSARSALG